MASLAFSEDRMLNTEDVSLPTKLSALLTLALGDMDSLDRLAFKPHSGAYYRAAQRAGERDEIDLGGAVVARRLGLPKTDVWFWKYEDAEIYGKLHALDLLRQGEIAKALVWTRRAGGVPAGVEGDWPVWESAVVGALTDEQRAVISGWHDQCHIASDWEDWEEYDDAAGDYYTLAAMLESVGL